MGTTWKTAAVLAACGLALAGCKTQIAARVSMSELADPEVVHVPGVVRLEVSNCSDHQDSRNPSDSLVKAQEMLPRIFPGAEFQECYRQEFDSWAQFDLPIAIDRSDDGEPTSTDTVNLLTTEGAPLGLYVPQALSQRLEEAGNASPMIGSLEMSMSVLLTNDTGEARTVQVLGAWVDGDPAVAEQYELPAGAETKFKLSDVSIAQARQWEYAPILLKP